MFADADHEVIDSPEALYRHLYEEHGVEEARELDPETAPLQFWLRRHTDLERAQRAARRQPDQPDPPPVPPAPRAEPGAGAGTPPAPRPQPDGRSRAESRPAPPPGGRGPVRPDGGGGGRDGRRHAGFGDPLVEAVARALAGRGHDEATVRTAIRSFAGDGGGPAGEAGVRAAFVEPMLQSVAEHLLGAGPPRPPARPRPGTATPAPPARPAADPAPAATTGRPAADPAPPPPGREEPARPEAAWAVLWADLAETGRRPGEDSGTAAEDRDDLMAVANAVQARRRVRLLRR